MRMRTRRIAVLALSGALVAGGTGAAIAAVTKDDAKKTEQAILDDAAKRLDVTPEKLRDALSAAQDAQLDQAVKDGDLTQKQADAIKAARQDSGRVLGGPGLRGPHGPGEVMKLRGGPGHHGAFGVRFELFGDLAKALGTTEAKLRAQLRDGKSIADVAKANGKSLADVRTAVRATLKTRLDKAVKAGDLTQKQADTMLDRISEKVTAIGSAKGLRLRGRHHRLRGGPGPDELRPGAFEPMAPDGPDIVMPADGVMD
jgi:uncharacterized protein (DUF433 family)